MIFKQTYKNIYFHIDNLIFIKYAIKSVKKEVCINIKYF